MSDDFAARVTAQLAAMPVVLAKTAVFIARDGYQAVVNIGEGSVSLPFNGMYLPPPGHPVQLELRADQLVVTGPARPLPGSGKITGTGSPRAEVTAWGVPYSLPYRATYTPALDDDVEIAWSGDGGVIQGKVTATSNVAAPETNTVSSLQLFRPGPFTSIGSGSRDSGGWESSSDVWASDSYTAAWFYGSKIRDTIPDTALIKTAAIYLNPRQAAGGAPILQLHNSPTRPGGAVTFVGSGFALPARSGWVAFPVAYVDYLKENDGGLGVNHGGFSIFRGVAADQLSGALDIAWEASP
jgi:hypothetical protein